MDKIKDAFDRLVVKIGYYKTVFLFVALAILLSIGAMSYDEIATFVGGMLQQ